MLRTIDKGTADPRLPRASRRYPLVIEVRVSHHEALASWRIEVRNLPSPRAGAGLRGLVAILLHRYNLRRARNRSARHANELAARVFEESFDAIFIADAERRIVRVNPAFTEITGCYPRARQSDERRASSPTVAMTMQRRARSGRSAAAGEWRGDRVTAATTAASTGSARDWHCVSTAAAR